MTTKFIEPIVEGFRDSLRLSVGIVVALVSVIAAFATHSQNSVRISLSSNPHSGNSD